MSQNMQRFPKPNWTIFVIGVIIAAVGLVCMFTPVWERVDFGYGYHTDIPSYPLFTVGVVLDFVGLMTIIASFFARKQENT